MRIQLQWRELHNIRTEVFLYRSSDSICQSDQRDPIWNVYKPLSVCPLWYFGLRGGATGEDGWVPPALENFGWVFLRIWGTYQAIFSDFGEICQTIFSGLGENSSLEKIIRQFSSILEIFCTKAANLSQEKTEKNSYHTQTHLPLVLTWDAWMLKTNLFLFSSL